MMLSRKGTKPQRDFTEFYSLFLFRAFVATNYFNH
jgi:hypothetical protein